MCSSQVHDASDRASGGVVAKTGLDWERGDETSEISGTSARLKTSLSTSGTRSTCIKH